MKNYKAKVKKIEQHIWKCGKYGTDDWHKEAVDSILSLIREIVQEAVGEKFELKDNMTSDFRSFLDGRNYQSNIILSNVEKLLK